MDQQLASLAQQFIDALHQLEGEQRDVEAIVALFADDARLDNPALTLAGQQRTGRDEVRAFWEEYRGTFRQARSEFHQITMNEQAVGLFWTTTGTSNDDRPLAYDGASLLVFNQSGKISAFRGYYDTRQLSLTVTSDT